MSAQHTPGPVGRALLDAAMLERIAAAVPAPNDMALCNIASRMRERAKAHDELVVALEGLMEVERRGRFMPIGREWDAARAAIAKATEAATGEQQ